MEVFNMKGETGQSYKDKDKVIERFSERFNECWALSW